MRKDVVHRPTLSPPERVRVRWFDWVWTAATRMKPFGAARINAHNANTSHIIQDKRDPHLFRRRNSICRKATAIPQTFDEWYRYRAVEARGRDKEINYNNSVSRPHSRHCKFIKPSRMGRIDWGVKRREAETVTTRPIARLAPRHLASGAAERRTGVRLRKILDHHGTLPPPVRERVDGLIARCVPYVTYRMAMLVRAANTSRLLRRCS
jgi:hypothetical protein